jgi:very-short-patch-repair endonuclease
MQNVAILPGRQAVKKLPGLYPWLEFQEYFTRVEWIESFGIDLEYINETAALAYLEGEAVFFKTYGDQYVAAIGGPRAVAIKQSKLEKIRGQFIQAASACGSPIEQILLAAIVWVAYGPEKQLVEIWDAVAHSAKPLGDVVIAPQYQIGRHRVDFAIFINIVANEEIRIVVECDGHNFHEKTKVQAARDKSRNRDLQIAGWKVLSFTGSEIWQDRTRCAAIVAELVKKDIEAQLCRRGYQISAWPSAEQSQRSGG